MRLFRKWRPDQISLVVVVEAEGLDDYGQQRLSDMWHGLFVAAQGKAVADAYASTPRRERRVFLERIVFVLHQWYKGSRDSVENKYGPQPLITKFEVWVCRGNVVVAPEGVADVIAILDLRRGKVL